MWIRTSSMSPYWLIVFNFIALAYNFIVLVCTTSTLGHLLPVRHQPDTLQYLGVCTGTHAEETTPSPCWYVLFGRSWVCFFLRRFTFTESMKDYSIERVSDTRKAKKKKTIKKLYIFGHSSIYTIWFWYWNYMNCNWSFRLFE